MKRILATILLVVLTFSSVILLSSCGARPKLDLEKAKENLEDKRYTVEYDDDCDPGIEECLYANKDDDNLIVITYSDGKLAKLAYKTMKMEVEHGKKSAELQLKSCEYILDKYGKKLTSEQEDEYKEEIESHEDKIEGYEDLIIGRSGKTVWCGTKNAIKASKGK